MENLTKIHGDWNAMKGVLKRKFALLTNSDELLIEGRHDVLLGRLQIKLGKTPEEIKKIIAEL